MSTVTLVQQVQASSSSATSRFTVLDPEAATKIREALEVICKNEDFLRETDRLTKQLKPHLVEIRLSSELHLGSDDEFLEEIKPNLAEVQNAAATSFGTAIVGECVTVGGRVWDLVDHHHYCGILKGMDKELVCPFGKGPLTAVKTHQLGCAIWSLIRSLPEEFKPTPLRKPPSSSLDSFPPALQLSQYNALAGQVVFREKVNATKQQTEKLTDDLKITQSIRERMAEFRSRIGDVAGSSSAIGLQTSWGKKQYFSTSTQQGMLEAEIRRAERESVRQSQIAELQAQELREFDEAHSESDRLLAETARQLRIEAYAARIELAALKAENAEKAEIVKKLQQDYNRLRQEVNAAMQQLRSRPWWHAFKFW